MSADRLDDKSSSPVDAVAASDAAICLNSPSSPPGLSKGVSVTSKDDHLPDGSVVSAKKRLTLLELPMDILKEIIKEVCMHIHSPAENGTHPVRVRVGLIITSR